MYIHLQGTRSIAKHSLGRKSRYLRSHDDHQANLHPSRLSYPPSCIRPWCWQFYFLLHTFISSCFLVFLQMAGIAGAIELNDRQRFRGFYRTDASSEFIGAALAEMARQFDWTQMAIISQSNNPFLMVCDYHYSSTSFHPRIIIDNRKFEFHISVRRTCTWQKYNYWQRWSSIPLPLDRQLGRKSQLTVGLKHYVADSKCNHVASYQKDHCKALDVNLVRSHQITRHEQVFRGLAFVSILGFFATKLATKLAHTQTILSYGYP